MPTIGTPDAPLSCYVSPDRAAHVDAREACRYRRTLSMLTTSFTCTTRAHRTHPEKRRARGRAVCAVRRALDVRACTAGGSAAAALLVEAAQKAFDGDPQIVSVHTDRDGMRVQIPAIVAHYALHFTGRLRAGANSANFAPLSKQPRLFQPRLEDSRRTWGHFQDARWI
ncbi:hypothetical protein PsYK624_170090 [Phanerochaete sordida]|uniref:Uncharacterized protein n=1 Tax=Phanerochaete sordida TaxID=48140 RepID=A0A9P3GYK8_9APHY|nr:hypothetical protein PsYK624_170090 [Phanerochaete sordida]